MWHRLLSVCSATMAIKLKFEDSTVRIFTGKYLHSIEMMCHSCTINIDIDINGCPILCLYYHIVNETDLLSTIGVMLPLKPHIKRGSPLATFIEIDGKSQNYFNAIGDAMEVQ